MADFFDRLILPELFQPARGQHLLLHYGQGAVARHQSLATARTRLRSPALLVENHDLSLTPPAASVANHTYPVNLTASTGKNNRRMTELAFNIL